MKKIFFLLFIITLLSCKSKVPVFEIDQEVNFVFLSGENPITKHGIIIHDIPSFLNKNLERKGLKLSDMKEFYAGRGKLESVGDIYDFGIFSKISISVFKKGDRKNKVEIYYHDQIPLISKGELKLLSTGEDVRDILSLDKYEMEVEYYLKGFSKDDIHCRLTFEYAAYIE